MAITDVNERRRTESYIGHCLTEILERSLRVEEYPLKCVYIQCSALADDGGGGGHTSSLAVAVNACCLAMIDAGLLMHYTPVAVDIAVSSAGELLLDPTRQEIVSSSAMFSFLVRGSNNGPSVVIQMKSSGVVTPASCVEQVQGLAVVAAQEVERLVRDCVAQKAR